MNGIDQAIIARANEIAALCARGENLVAACAKMSVEEMEALEEAVRASNMPYFFSFQYIS